MACVVAWSAIDPSGNLRIRIRVNVRGRVRVTMSGQPFYNIVV